LGPILLANRRAAFAERGGDQAPHERGEGMADIVEIRFRVGSGEAGIALYEKAHPKVLAVLESGKYPGFIVHTCQKTEDGVRVVDVWEDASQWQALFADPDVIESLQALGAPEPEVEIRPLHNVMRAEVTANA
jgi:hypothetical protein